MARVEINPEDTLVIDPEKPELDLPLEMLRRIITNASKVAWMIRWYVGAMEVSGRKSRFHKRSALRLADTLHDSLQQMALLLDGKDLDEYSTPTTHQSEEITLDD